MANALSYIASETRRNDRDRFLCSLFAPEETREGLFAVLAFNIEVAKTREMVREGGGATPSGLFMVILVVKVLIMRWLRNLPWL
jgi:phytoene/squalene synthetase